MNLSYHDKSVDHISLSYNREPSIITLSQNDQNLDPPPPLFALVRFWYSPTCERSKLSKPYTHPLQKQKIV